jgi:hypothetical protein
MTTIPALTDAPLPLTGAERVPIDPNDGTHTYDAATGDLATLGALYAHAALGAGPERLDAAATYFTTQGGGDPLAVWFPPAVVAVGGYGFAASYVGPGSLYTRNLRAAPAGRVWEVEAVVEQVSVGASENPTARLGIHCMKSDFTDTSGAPEVYGPASAVLTAGQVVTLTYRFASVAPYGGAAWADPATAQLLRPLVQVNGGGAGSSVARVRRLLIRDVTAIVGAASSSVALVRERFKTLPIVAGVLTLDLSAGNFFVVPLTANITSMLIQGYPPVGEAEAATVVFVADGTVRTIAWAAAIKWLGGAAPTSGPNWSSTLNYENWCVFVARDGVARVVGSFSGNAAP